MKICVATGNVGGLDDMVSMQFGRCPTFTLVDVEGGKIRDVKVITNPGGQTASGAGVVSGQVVVNSGCNVVISGAIGPNSYQVLKMGGVDMCASPAVKVKEAVDMFLKGSLPPIQEGSMVGGGVGPGMGRGMGRGRRMGRGQNW